ncbi:MAG: NAD-dependent epimerase/dehydratase family protein [Chloroflexota bacterium]
MTQRLLITGSTGLIGSEAATYFGTRGWQVTGVDNNMRREFFGADGDTTANHRRLVSTTPSYVHRPLDIRDRAAMMTLVAELRPKLIIHCAAQPSHDLAARRPFDDFDINATGTLNLLEAARQACPESPFIFMSTNKVYGDAPNELPLRELSTRYDYARPEDAHGVAESMRVDATTHSLFGVSKLAADAMVQEYGRYFGMPTVCLRAGCMTGPQHSSAELHGFLAYVARAVAEKRTYRIFGYLGKQVRDNIHAFDLCTFFEQFFDAPRAGAVYNIGGGRANSISVLEALDQFGQLLGIQPSTEYVPQNRTGDHICYISDLRRLKTDYPQWGITRSLPEILEELAAAARAQAA